MVMIAKAGTLIHGNEKTSYGNCGVFICCDGQVVFPLNWHVYAGVEISSS